MRKIRLRAEAEVIAKFLRYEESNTKSTTRSAGGFHMLASQNSARLSVPLLVTAMLLASSFSVAQEVSPQQVAPQNSSQPLPQQSRSSGLIPDPSSGPLQPHPAQDQSQQLPPSPSPAPLPEAPQPAPVQQSSQPPAQIAPQEPLGAAAAEQIKTAGGAASRPAGNAIAPAKQHQYRSLFIKLGVVAAAGVAAGSVYGLSRATASTPPHSASAK
jgi:flagellar motor protein MotB